MSEWQQYLEAEEGRFLDEYLDYLRIPSISSLPDHAADVARAGAWVAARLAAAGLENGETLPTGGHPVVYADWLHAPGAPTVLIYGHFDVQPVDPLELWTTPPFEPSIRDGKVYARGASDNKGNMFVAVAALEALIRTGGLHLNVKCLFEGQEEIGSPQLPTFLAAHRDRFACDLVISSDANQWSEEQPAIELGNRGLAGVQIDVRGATSDLHSGLFGGPVANPIIALSQIIASMRAPDGTILVDGFFDSVRPLSPQEREQYAAIPFDAAAFGAGIGVTTLIGEPGYTPVELLTARPTLDVNGIWGGFMGAGTKTVLPAEAHAKVTCRLVPDQEPEQIVALLAAHAQRHAPPGVTVQVQPLPGRARPYRMPEDHWANAIAAAVLKEEYGRDPLHVRMGGSVPVVELFLSVLNAYTVSFGFGLSDERFHAPDEFYRLASFKRGKRAFAHLLVRLGS